MKRLLGIRSLLHDAVDATVQMVEEAHLRTAKQPVALLKPVPAVGEGAAAVGMLHAGIAKLAYGSVRWINRGIEYVGDASLAIAAHAGIDRALAPHLEGALELDPEVEQELRYWTDTAQSALNAWLGDFLSLRGNTLAVPFSFFAGGRPLEATRESFAEALPNASSKVCIFIHGLGCTDATWSFRAHAHWGDREASYARFLQRDHGYTPLHVRYNTGLHISQNARELTQQLEQLLELYPSEIEEIALVGHSMGGLVSRGAAHYAHKEQMQWVQRLTHVLCIGSPNLGAPLEQATHMLTSLLSRLDTPGTQIPAKLLNTRSAGIKDLRFGYVVDDDWVGKDPDAPQLTDDRNDVPMVPTVTYGFVAATFLRDPDHPLGHLLGDLLVRVPSASGKAPDPARHVRFDMGHVVHGVHHLAMLNHPRVYALIEAFLTSRVLAAEGELIEMTRIAGALPAPD